MNKFDKAQFSYSGGYLTYGPDYANKKFVARFKYKGAVTKGAFLKQLVKNHTVEEYFAKLDQNIAPLTILRDADPVWYDTCLAKFKAKLEARF